MFKFLADAGNKLLGTVAGAITGIAAGFSEANSFWSKKGRGAIAGTIKFFLYLPTLPFFMLWQMFNGGYEGATKGLNAGLNYPKTVSDKLKQERIAYEKTAAYLNQESISERVTRIIRTPYESYTLSPEEKQEVESGMNHPLTAQVHKDNYARYKTALNMMVCPLTRLSFEEMDRPIVVRLNDRSIFCEAKAFRDLVQRHERFGDPVSFRRTKHPNPHEIIRKDDVHDCGKEVLRVSRFFPQAVSSFVNFIRRSGLSSTAELVKPLAIEAGDLGVRGLGQVKASEPIRIPVRESSENGGVREELMSNENPCPRPS